MIPEITPNTVILYTPRIGLSKVATTGQNRAHLKTTPWPRVRSRPQRPSFLYEGWQPRRITEWVCSWNDFQRRTQFPVPQKEMLNCAYISKILRWDRPRSTRHQPPTYHREGPAGAILNHSVGSEDWATVTQTCTAPKIKGVKNGCNLFNKVLSLAQYVQDQLMVATLRLRMKTTEYFPK